MARVLRMVQGNETEGPTPRERLRDFKSGCLIRRAQLNLPQIGASELLNDKALGDEPAAVAQNNRALYDALKESAKLVHLAASPP